MKDFGLNKEPYKNEAISLQVEPSLAESDRQIFFIETICAEKSNCGIILSDRKLCAIESTARLHPNHKIFVLLVNAHGVELTDNLDLVTKVSSYPNVHFRSINLVEYSKNTPLEQFFATKRYVKSNYMTTHLSDILRMLTLWKYGGTYFDSDMICLKNIEALGRNWAAEADKDTVGGAMINFGSGELGRLMAELCVVELNNTFDGTNWSTNGPQLITRVLERFCNASNVYNMTQERCHGFKVQQRDTFAPIVWQHAVRYFEEEWTDEVMKKVKNSYTAHTFNHMTSERIADKTANVAYALLAKEFCPDMFYSPRKSF